MSLRGLLLKLKQQEPSLIKPSRSSRKPSRGPRSLRTSQALAESVGFKTAHTAVYNRQKSILFVAFLPLQLPLWKCVYISLSNFWQRSAKISTTESYLIMFPLHTIWASPETDSSHGEAAIGPDSCVDAPCANLQLQTQSHSHWPARLPGKLNA